MPNEVRLTSVFSEWLDGLKDQKAIALVTGRIERLGYGLVGDAKVFDGIGELRIDYGPGYRIYFCRRGGVLHSALWWHEANAGSGHQTSQEVGAGDWL